MYDFHYLYIISKTVKPLLAFGIDRADIRSNGYMKDRFYSVSIHGEIDDLENIQKSASAVGLKSVMRYHAN